MRLMTSFPKVGDWIAFGSLHLFSYGKVTSVKYDKRVFFVETCETQGLRKFVYTNKSTFFCHTHAADHALELTETKEFETAERNWNTMRRLRTS